MKRTPGDLCGRARGGRPRRHARALGATVAALILTLITGVAAAATAPGSSAREARLLRFPDIHGDTIAFSHGGDLWSVSTSGGVARRLTTGRGLEVFPRFSPDGKWIAFTGQYDGTSDVYVMPAQGGQPRRLTWYPARALSDRMGVDNMVLGWTPDGKILFRSARGPIGGFLGQPYVVDPRGGPVSSFPLPEAGFISFSPDHKRVACTRIFRDFRPWKRYQGGMAQDVWLYELGSHRIERVTRWRGTDTQPMWIGNAIYFLSDRQDWKVNLWRYDLSGKAFTQLTHFREFDVKWAHAGSGRIVFENGGFLYLFDPAAGAARKVPVSLPDDERYARHRWIQVQKWIGTAALAPDGKRAVFTARGDVFTVPAQHGDVRNLTRTQGVREKDAVWSPDGKWIAYFSDATGNEELYVIAQDGASPPTRLTNGPPSWHFPPVWSPDSRKIAYGDRGLRLWYVSLEDRKPVLVAKGKNREISEYAWSPDGRWLAYVGETEAYLSSIFLYSLGSKTATQVTSSAFNSHEPVFDPQGRYLFLLSDRDVSPTLGNLESDYTINKMTRPHAITLRADLPSPFAPRSDEVGGGKKKGKEKKGTKGGGKTGEGKTPPRGGESGQRVEPVKTATGSSPAKDAKASPKGKPAPKPLRIDLGGIQARIVPFPVPPGNDRGLKAAKGKVYWLSLPTMPLGGHRAGSVEVFDLKKRKKQRILAQVERFDLSRDGKRVLYKSKKTWGIVEPKKGLKVGKGKLKLSGMRMELDPKAEWAQIFAETWRLYRDFFYLPNMGKVDWPAMRKRYAALLPWVTHRFDLNFVLAELSGELASGHAYVGGGDLPSVKRVPVGTLGADLELDPHAGRWRIKRILPGQSWIPSRRSPLAEPGIRVSAGDYLLEIDGRELKASDNPYRLLVETPGRTIRLKVSAKPELAGAREVRVRPLPNEWDLRYFDWIESNRRRVEKATAGRVGYVHIPDMGERGLKEFIRQYYPQIRKQGLIVDVRANGGGFVSEMILERLRRRVVGMSNMRQSRPYTYPDAAFHGPMVALINSYSASDGDIFPYFFRVYGLGPLIGRRTWGGTVGIRGLGSRMVDGGYTFVPEFGVYNLRRRWVAENRGVPPDIEVDNLPADVLAGRDPQLERAIAEIEKRLGGRKPLPRPPPPKDLRHPPKP